MDPAKFTQKTQGMQVQPVGIQKRAYRVPNSWCPVTTRLHNLGWSSVMYSSDVLSELICNSPQAHRENAHVSGRRQELRLVAVPMPIFVSGMKP